MTQTQPADTQLDQAQLEGAAFEVAIHMTGAMLSWGILLGDDLGLYRAMAEGDPMTSAEVASAAGCQPRLVREWLDGQVAGGLIGYDTDGDLYRLSPERAAVLADDGHPAFVARGMNSMSALFIDLPKVAKAFRSDGALAWGDHHDCLFNGTEWFFRPGYRALLASEWLPAMDGVVDRLALGGRVADVGCGHGASAIVMAEAFPNAEIVGYDIHEPSLRTARVRAREQGTDDRVSFEHASATSYPGDFDLICFFDCLHDMGDPAAAASYAKAHLVDDGAVLLVEPFAHNTRAENIANNPMAAMLYTASAGLCTPNSLSQDRGLGLGAQAGEAVLRGVLEEAGFSTFRRVAETPVNLIFEARP